jgi:hypothetical protein
MEKKKHQQNTKTLLITCNKVLTFLKKEIKSTSFSLRYIHDVVFSNYSKKFILLKSQEKNQNTKTLPTMFC